eukprot:COSAG02_NODE_3190_length_7200_cov_5.803408_5_plen_249_part_00
MCSIISGVEEKCVVENLSLLHRRHNIPAEPPFICSALTYVCHEPIMTNIRSSKLQLVHTKGSCIPNCIIELLKRPNVIRVATIQPIDVVLWHCRVRQVDVVQHGHGEPLLLGGDSACNESVQLLDDERAVVTHDLVGDVRNPAVLERVRRIGVPVGGADEALVDKCSTGDDAVLPWVVMSELVDVRGDIRVAPRRGDALIIWRMPVGGREAATIGRGGRELGLGGEPLFEAVVRGIRVAMVLADFLLE